MFDNLLLLILPESFSPRKEQRPRVRAGDRNDTMALAQKLHLFVQSLLLQV
jgi:hypothetical protein